MVNKKINPGKYPVPQAIIDQAKKQNKYAQAPKWWPTKELVTDLCSRLGNGETITAIAKDPTFPKKVCLFDWIARANGTARERDRDKPQHPDFDNLRVQWSRARSARLEASIEQIEEIEEQLIKIPQRIESETVDSAGRHYNIDNPKALNPQAARIVLESRRWRLSRELPDRFGDKSKVEHSGSVTVEKAVDAAPEWMQEKIKDQAAQVAQVEPPVPAKPASPDEATETVH